MHYKSWVRKCLSLFFLIIFLFKFRIEFDFLNYGVNKSKHPHKDGGSQPSVVDQGHPWVANSRMWWGYNFYWNIQSNICHGLMIYWRKYNLIILKLCVWGNSFHCEAKVNNWKELFLHHALGKSTQKQPKAHHCRIESFHNVNTLQLLTNSPQKWGVKVYMVYNRDNITVRKC